MIGRTISHYKILEKLGEGGMGVVYKAEDTKLKRSVALKFLPPELTRNEGAKERFIHEAQAASALQHSNICNIHDIDETDDGRLFIVMDCYEGEMLKEKIARGPMKLEEAVDIALQAASGLSKAHEKGIIHRDVKPANIFVTTDGTVKILDFGLAKLPDRTLLTRAGTTLGTVEYMSPEQAKGESVDQRTDIWSLGVILYEMFTGQRPFTGEYDQAVIYSILDKHPQPLSALRPDLRPELERIVDTCLQKDPSARYQSTGELLTDLMEYRKVSDSKDIVRKRKLRFGRITRKKAWKALSGIVLAGGIALLILYLLFTPGKKQPQSPIKRLVVLPFENLGPSENEYFTDGMTEELTTRLASLSGLGVISRTSAVQYAKTDKTIEQVGKELSVDYALGGAVRWARARDGSSRVRIDPNLVRIKDMTTLWAETYDRVIDDIFAVQSEISQKVVEKLGITLLEKERRAVEIAPTRNLEAYQAYLRARYYESRPHFTSGNWLRVVEGYQQAVELDSGFALAYAELARAHSILYYLWYDHSAGRLDMAAAAADRAMTLAPELPGVHLALGYYRLYSSPLRKKECPTMLIFSRPRLWWRRFKEAGKGQWKTADRQSNSVPVMPRLQPTWPNSTGFCGDTKRLSEPAIGPSSLRRMTPGPICSRRLFCGVGRAPLRMRGPFWKQCRRLTTGRPGRGSGKTCMKGDTRRPQNSSFQRLIHGSAPSAGRCQSRCWLPTLIN
jgi:serine/threonine protein kinase